MTARRAVPIDPASLDARQAAAYLNVSLSHFHEDVRRYLPTIDLRKPGASKPMLRWLRADLDAYLAARRKDAAA